MKINYWVLLLFIIVVNTQLYGQKVKLLDKKRKYTELNQVNKNVNSKEVLEEIVSKMDFGNNKEK